METESFEDQEVATFLNNNFIAIKVDKEERPDIDNVYMSVCQAQNGSGGWPLTILMFPTKQPFYSGTYFPKFSKYNQIGLLDLLNTINNMWINEREKLKRSGEEIITFLNSSGSPSKYATITKSHFEQAIQYYKRTFDPNYGGFGQAPKFPTPHNLMFLLRYAHYEQNKTVLKMVEKTIEGMYQGGLFDHIGYGFSRYSTDEKWLAPHFEKMLYDNALLTIIYLESYQITKNPLYKDIVVKTLAYVQNELTSPEGGFYCGQDADSEGVEGKYYTFVPNEITTLLGIKSGHYFNEYYDITDKGNFEGKNIPNRIEKAYDENDTIINLREIVYDYRSTRTKLHKDDKIITSWNGLMIVAFAKAAFELDNSEYLETAKQAHSFILDKLYQNGSLMIRYRDGNTQGHGHIDDYAFMIWSNLALYESTFEADYLVGALKFMRQMIEYFFDPEEGGFYHYSTISEPLIYRSKETYDGAIPSGNSVATYCLIKLVKITADPELNTILEKQMDFMAGQIGDYPYHSSFALTAYFKELYTSRELICVADTTQDLDELITALHGSFHPNLDIIVKTKANEEILNQFIPYLKNYDRKDNKTTYYLCQNHNCSLPTHSLEGLLS